MTLLLMLLLKSLLVFAFAAAALLGLRRASAAARHLVCLLTLVSLLALPLFSVTLPGWHLPVLAQAQVAETALPEPTPSRSSSTLPKREGEEFRAQPLSTPLRPPVSGGPLRSEERTKQGGGFLTLYVLGLLLASVRPLLGLWGIQRLHRLCVNADDAPTLAAVIHCAALLRLKTPRLCRADVAVPMTWGGRRPVVLLPNTSPDWPEDRLHSVLLHEMAHIKRRDWSCHRLADLVCALYWFHPLVWLTARRLRTESELACDDLVLSSGIPAADYARHLLEIAGSLRPASPASQTAIAMAQTSKIEGRLRLILNGSRDRRTMTRAAWGLAAVLTFGTALAIATAETPPRTLMVALTSGGYSSDTAAQRQDGINYLQAQITRFGDHDPWAGKAYYELGNVQMADGRSDDALASFRKAITLPEPPYAGSDIHSIARYERINTLESAGRYAEATAETEALLKNGGRGLITANLWENLRERLPEFKMMGSIETNRAAEQAQYRGLMATPRWTQTLPGGVTVQLVGVMQSTGKVQTVWSPEGKLISQDQYETDAGHGNYLDNHPTTKMDMILRFSYPAGQAILTEYTLSGSLSSSFQSGPDREGRQVVTDENAMNRDTAGCRSVEAWFPRGQAQTDLRVGVALVPPPFGQTDPTGVPKDWVEFPNIALRPTSNALAESGAVVLVSGVIPPQNYNTPWTSQVTKSYWQPHTTFHFAVHIAPGREGTRPDPPVTGSLVYGPGRASSFSVQAWKPGRSNILTVKFDYTPKVADKVHPDIIHLLTKQGTIAAVLTYYSL